MPYSFYNGTGDYSAAESPNIWTTNCDTPWVIRPYVSTELAGDGEFRDDDIYLKVRDSGDWIPVNKGQKIKIEWKVDDVEVGGEYIDKLSCHVNFLIHFKYKVKPDESEEYTAYSATFISDRVCNNVYYLLDEMNDVIIGTVQSDTYIPDTDINIVALEGRIFFDGAADGEKRFTSSTSIRVAVYVDNELVIGEEI